MSPSIERIPAATFACVKRFGSVGGASANPVRSAPRDCSHSESQLPLKPVCPVMNTRRPRQKARSRSPGGGEPSAIRYAVALPDFPGRLALGHDRVQLLLILERVHRLPEAVVLVRHQLTLLDQPVERLVHELLALIHVIED